MKLEACKCKGIHAGKGLHDLHRSDAAKYMHKG